MRRRFRILAGILTAAIVTSSAPPTLAAAADGDTTNLALNVQVKADWAKDGNTVGQLVDGITDGENGAVSNNGVGTPQEIVLTWKEACDFNQIDLYSSYASGQGPTRWDIAVATNGNDWKTVAKDVKADWKTQDGTVENKSVTLKQQSNIKGLKLIINDYANAWGHFYIKDLQVFNNDSKAKELQTEEKKLDDALKEAEEKIGKTDEYSQTSLENLQKAIDAAKAEGMDYYDAVVQNTENLQAALNALVKATETRLVTAEGCDGSGKKYATGETVTITAPYKKDSSEAFVKWETTDITEDFLKENEINLSQNPLSFPMPDGDSNITLTPVYKKQIVSSKTVRGENGKGYLEVAGVPWLYTFVQNMGKWERMGHQEEFKEKSGNPDQNYPTSELPLEFLENMYEKTAHLNYSTISQALMWRDIEIEPGVYDFTVIDQYVKWAKEYNMKLDLAWFGSACQSGSRIPNLSSARNDEGREADLGYQFTAPWWYVKEKNGKEIGTYYQLGGAGGVDYKLKLTGDDAEYMKQREYYALQALFNHLAEIDTDSTVIAIQIENEPNMRGSDFDVQAKNWINYLGKAVKESAYVVATRLNFSGWGYPVNANELEYIDFEGPDPYTTGLGNIKGILNGGESNSDITYIAENSGNYENLTSLTTAAFTNGGFYGTWALDNWFCDGGSGHFNGPHSLYENIKDDYNTRYYNWKLGTIPGLTPQATDIMHYNKGLNKMGRIIAAASKKEMQGFNVENDNPQQNYDNMKSLGSYKIGYKAEDASLAIAAIDGQNIYMTSDTAETVQVKMGQEPLKVTEGKINNNGEWEQNSVKEVKTGADGIYLVELKSEECIRMEMPQLTNLALSANITSTSVGDATGFPVENMNDGDVLTGSLSQDNPTFPQYITLTWNEGKSFNKVNLAGIFAQSQNPTNWDIEVSDDGTNNWTNVASSGDVTWSTNNEQNSEEKSITFDRQTGKKGLRIKINKANLTWNHYFVTEVQVFDDEKMEMPKLKNLALSANNIESTSVGNAQKFSVTNMKDGNVLTGSLSQDNPTFPQYITLTWNEGKSFNKVNLAGIFAQSQNPTNWDIEVSDDGTNNWTNVASSGDVTWSTNDANNPEEKSITFDRQTGKKGLRIKINKANLTWNHYFVTEVQVFDDEQESNKPTPTPATPAPATPAPATQAPATQAPATQTPATQAPATQTPATQAPATQTPATQTPATQTPATQTPATQAPATQTPATQAPATQTPATQTPATQTPATQTPATQTEETQYTVTYKKDSISNANISVSLEGKEFISGSKAVLSDKVRLVITPEKDYSLTGIPKITADNAIVGEPESKDGSYIFTIHTFTGNTNIAISGKTVKIQYSVTISNDVEESVKANHATARLDMEAVCADSVAKLLLTPEEGYKITPSVIKRKADTCKVSGWEKGANGTYTITLSEFTGNTEITEITVNAAKTQVYENGTDTSVNIGAGNLSETDFTKEDVQTITDAIIDRECIETILNEENKEIESADKQQEVIDEITTAVKNDGSSVEISVEINYKTDFDKSQENEVTTVLQNEVKKDVEKELGEAVEEPKIAMPLDISLFAKVAKVAGKVKLKSTKAKNMVIKMIVPSTIKKEEKGVTRLYYIIRFHGTEKKYISCNYDEAANTIKFNSDRFSTYVLCYVDTKKAQPAVSGTPVSGTPVGGGTAVVFTSAPAPNTGTGTGTSAPTPTPTSAPTPTPTSTPSTDIGSGIDTATPVPADIVTPTSAPETPSETKTPVPEIPDHTFSPAGSTTFTTANAMYTISENKKTAVLTGVQKNVKKLTVPASIKVGKKKYKVTTIAKNALKGNKKITKVTIGTKVTKIGKNAFKNCKKLKKIIIKSKKLKKKNVGKNAFKGINKKATIKVPKTKTKLYKKIVKARGTGKKVKVTK